MASISHIQDSFATCGDTWRGSTPPALCGMSAANTDFHKCAVEGMAPSMKHPPGISPSDLSEEAQNPFHSIHSTEQAPSCPYYARPFKSSVEADLSPKWSFHN